MIEAEALFRVLKPKGAAIPGQPVTVNTRLYRLVHGEGPRGARTWSFSLGQKTGVFSVPDAPYAEAKRKAIRKAGQLGVDHITVLP